MKINKTSAPLMTVTEEDIQQIIEDDTSKASLVDGKVPSEQLPSYVDDVLEFNSISEFPAEGEEGKIYVAIDSNKTYRWSGSAYVLIADPDLTAYEKTATVDTKLAGKADLVDGKVPADQLPDNVATKSYVDTGLATKQDAGDYATNSALETGLAAKQAILVSGENIKTINGDSLLGDGNIDVANLVSITWADLKALRDNGTLVPGCLYRITDYACTTTQTNTSSAGHMFDIIVTADDVNVLNENARAIQHSGDTYFANNDLAAWELKYSLDNDTDKFAWADATNGKGVIYWMKDEFNNECPYDFKNILFRKDSVNAYTFSYTSSYVLYDASLEGLTKQCYSNVIKEYTTSNKLTLNANVFYSTGTPFTCYGNSLGADCYNNFFKHRCYGNSFGAGCFDNNFDSDCYHNTFGARCYQNTFGAGCYRNTFGAGCYINRFYNDCYYNTFGAGCFSNRFGTNCQHNSFGNGCDNNSFETNCLNNSFGAHCQHNSFGNSFQSSFFGAYCRSNVFGNDSANNFFGNRCENNSFGNRCGSNTFGNGCGNNTFGTCCFNNTFGSGCKYNTFGTADGAINYCQYNIFDNGCSYIYLSSEDTTASDFNYLQNVHIHLGVKGSSSSDRLSIVASDRNYVYSVDYYAPSSTSIILDGNTEA